jgi:hypothetical protein
MRLLALVSLSDAAEAREMSRVSRELSDRWGTVSVELRCVHSLLEKVIMFWRHYSSTAENIESWLDTAATMVKADENQRMEFFRVSNQISFTRT